MLRQAKNYVRIEGYLAEKDIKIGSKQLDDGSISEYIFGTIHIQLDQEIGEDTKLIDVPVSLYAKKYTKIGKLNPSYTSIERVMNEFNSIASAGGREKADIVRISNGKITMNEYFGQNGTFVSYPRIRASFIDLVKNTPNFEATFGIEFMLNSVTEVVDVEGIPVEPRKLKVTAILPQYGEKVDIVDFYAVTPQAIDVVENYWEVNNTYNPIGKLNFSTTTVEVLEELDFGEPIKRQKTTSVSELVITGGRRDPVDEEFEFNLDEIRQALNERSERLKALKDRPQSVKGTKITPAQTGFNVNDLGF